MKKLIGLTLLVAVLATGSAQAQVTALLASAPARPTLLRPDGSPAVAEQRIANRMRVPTVDYTITVHNQDNPGGGLDGVGGNAECVDAACSSLAWTSRDIYLHPTPWGFDPYSLRHELGHYFDQEFMDDAERERFSALVGMSGIPWLNGGAGGQVPGEAFADAYARIAKFGAKPPSGAFGNGSYGFQLSRKNARPVARFIRYAATH